MRAIFGVLSLLMVVAVIAVLAKKQLSPAPVKPAPADGATPQQQSQQIQNQVRQSLETTMQQARPMPEDK